MALEWVKYGRLPYLGSWDQNFPGIIPIHALGILLFGNSDLGFQLISWILSTASATMLYMVTRKFQGEGVSILTAIMYALYYTQRSIYVSGQRDVFVVFFLLVSILVLLSGFEGSWRTWVIAIAGLSAGYAVFIRPTYALAFLVLAAFVFHKTKRPAAIVWFCVAGIIPFVVFIIPYFAHPGAYIGLYDAMIRFNLDVYSAYPTSLYTIRVALLNPWYIWLTALAGVFLWRHRENNSVAHSGKERVLWNYYFLILASLFLSTVVMRKFLSYQMFVFYAFLVPLSVYAVVELYRVLRRAAASYGLPRAVLPGAAFILLAVLSVKIMSLDPIVPFFRALRHGSTASFALDTAEAAYTRWQGPVSPPLDIMGEKKVVRYLQSRVPPDSAVECCTVWPGLIWRLARPTATRFTTLYPVCLPNTEGTFTSYQVRWQKEYMDSLRTVRPRYIVLVSAKKIDMLFLRTTPINLVHFIPGFSDFLARNYTMDTVIDWYVLYRRVR